MCIRDRRPPYESHGKRGWLSGYAEDSSPYFSVQGKNHRASDRSDARVPGYFLGLFWESFSSFSGRTLSRHFFISGAFLSKSSRSCLASSALRTTLGRRKTINSTWRV